MGIYVGDAEIKGIYLGDTLLKEVYLGDTKIRPVWSEKVYTIQIDESKSNSAQMFVGYSDDAVGMSQGSAAWDSIFGFSEETLGSNAMMKFPSMGLKVSRNGDIVTISLTNKERAVGEAEGYQYYAFYDRDTSTYKDQFYLGRYLSWRSSSILYSGSGYSILGNQTIGTCETRSAANGSGWHQMGFYQRAYINALYLMKYGNPNARSVIGVGHTGTNYLSTGGTNGLSGTLLYGNDSGNYDYGTSDQGKQVKLFGLEDWWGNKEAWLDQNTIQCSGWNYSLSHGGTTELVSSGYSGSYKEGGLRRTKGTNAALFLPDGSNNGLGGTQNNYYCCWCNVQSGGRFAVGRIAGYSDARVGAFTLNGTLSTSYKNSMVGSRLLYVG